MNPDCPHGGKSRCAQCDAFVAEALAMPLNQTHFAILENIGRGRGRPFTVTPRYIQLGIPGLPDPVIPDPYACLEHLKIKALVEIDPEVAIEDHYYGLKWRLTDAGKAALAERQVAA